MVIRTCNHRSAHSDPSIHPAVPSTVNIPNTESIQKNEKVGSTNPIGQHLKVTRIEQQKKVRSKQQTGKHLVIRKRESCIKGTRTYVTYMYLTGIHADQMQEGEKIGEKKKGKKRKSG